MKPKPFESFLCQRDSGCIEWTGTTSKSSGSEKHRYGRVTRGGKKLLAHRVAYEIANGKIPDGLHVLHKCDNPLCCNPEHLFLGTHADNMRDAKLKGRFSRVSRPGRKGELSPKAKLTDVQVSEIRNRRLLGETTVSIGNFFSIHCSHVSRICRGLRR